MKIIALVFSLLFPTEILAKEFLRFAKLNKNDFHIIKDEIRVENLPRHAPQGALGICYATTSKFIVQHYYCQINKKDCSQIGQEEEISTLMAVAFERTHGDGYMQGEISSHSRLRFDDGGSNYDTIYAMTKAGLFYSDACFPFEQTLKRHGRNGKSWELAYKKLEASFNKQKKLGASACIECLQKDFNDAFGSNHKASTIASELKAATFDRFLYGATIASNDCDKIIEIKRRHTPEVEIFPPSKAGKNASYSQEIDTIKSVLKSGQPLALGGICLADPLPGSKFLCESHAVAVIGYRMQCSSSGECRDVLRVQNSWGQDWQERHDDGWIDAKTLLDNSDPNDIVYLLHGEALLKRNNSEEWKAKQAANVNKEILKNLEERLKD